MVRTVKSKYGAWLAGYYDDFQSSRAIPNDDNSPSATATYDKDKTHFGNPMNGEATLNPRYRWSNNEMSKSNNFNTALIGTSDETRYLSNTGASDWLTLDTIRNSPNEREGRAQLQYPDGHVPNEFKFAGSGDDGYIYFTNGNDTSGRYVVPVGDTDSSFGRVDINNYTVSNYNSKTAGTASNSAGFVSRAHLAGVWMGETTEFAHTDGGTVESPRLVFAPVKSNSGQPFLVVQSYHASATSQPNNHTTHQGKVPTIAYDGSLNGMGDGDVFSIRLAVRGFTGSTTNEGVIKPLVELRIGFEGGGLSTSGSSKISNGLTGTPKIKWTLDLSSYDTLALRHDNDTDISADVEHWIDLDFVVDYTNTKFKVYQDGTEVTSTNTLGGSYSSGYTLVGSDHTPGAMYGYEIVCKADTGQTNAITSLLLDRAAMCKPLTDHPDGRVLPPLQSLEVKNVANGFSSCELKVSDDPAAVGGTSVGDSSSDYNHNLLSAFTGSTVNDINLLIFTSATKGFNDETHNIDRPTWRGVVNKLEIKQRIKERFLEISALDNTSILDRQIPLWEIGQSGLDDDEAITPYWLRDAQGMKHAMNFGSAPLKTLSHTVGFDKDDDYAELIDQRTQIDSGHPIQMYNNEDTNYGPDSIEEQYEGVKIVGFGRDSAGRTIVYFEKDSGWEGVTGESFNITRSTSHDTTSAQNVVNLSLNDTLFDDYEYVVLNVTSGAGSYTADSARIVYRGKAANERFGVDQDFPTTDPQQIHEYNVAIFNNPGTTDPISDTVVLFMDADPNLSFGDIIVTSPYNENGVHINDGGNTIHSIHRVRNVTRVWNYYSNYLTQRYLWVVDTFTPYDGLEWGDYTIDGGLKSGNNRASFSSDNGMTDVFDTGDDKNLRNKAVHARWMRDLPKSLWFQYHFGQIRNSPKTFVFPVGHATTRTETNIGAAITAGDKLVTTSILTSSSTIPNSGCAEIHGRNGFVDKFLYQGIVHHGGKLCLIGCKYISKSHPTNYTENGVSKNTIIKFCDISEDYKHLWLLWADMRNNGKADADGSSRKSDFGLIYPTSKNYDVSLFYTDQDADSDGKLDKFTDLKVGLDIDIWNIDATSDPVTNGSYSKIIDYDNPIAISSISKPSSTLKFTVGSGDTAGIADGDYIYVINSDAQDGYHQVSGTPSSTEITTTTVPTSTDYDESAGGALLFKVTIDSQTEYASWEDKGGAFLVVDASPFFNLNTRSNKGKIGQFSGGKTTLGDYIATVSGFPTLVDRYWSEAIAKKTNVADPYSPHPNEQFIISESTPITQDLERGQFFITFDEGTDISMFDGLGGLARLQAVKNSGETNQSITDYFVSYHGKLSTVVKGTATGATANTHDFTMQDTSATFSDSGVKAGMFLQNTSVPLTDITVANSGNDVTGPGNIFVRRYFRVKEVVNNTTLKLELVYYNSSLTSQGFHAGVNYTAGLNVRDNLTATEDALFPAIGESYSLLPQLFGVQTTSVSSAGIAQDATPSDVVKTVSDIIANTSTQLSVVNSPLDVSQFDVVNLFNSVAPAYLMRLMMKIDGYVESTNRGTYYESDKIRTLWNAGILQNWFPSTKLSSTPDINNVPITTHMTTYNSNLNLDKFGSSVDSRGKTILKTIQSMKEKAGNGRVNSLTQPFSYLQGRDGRIEFRPKYQSGHVLNRDNTYVSSVKTDVGGKISNVRVYYNRGESFVDFPSPNLTDTSRWKVLERPEVRTDVEATAIAKKTFNSLKESRLSLKVKPIRKATEDDKMLTDGRFAYLADPHRALAGRNDTSDGECWMALKTGGVLFPGMVNALDGNLKTSTDKFNRYGQSKTYDASSSTISYDDAYYFYGANSLSYAVQIVHAPSGCPLASETGQANDLRMAVYLKDGQTASSIDDAVFVVGLFDYNFGLTSTAKGGGSPTLAATAKTNGVSTIEVKQSGFYEIAAPTSYSASLGGDPFVISVNADYLRGLLRHRCGDPTQTTDGAANYILDNAHDVTGVSSFAAYNDKSIFPLGMRKYSEMSAYGDHRAEWYAPRIHVTKDYNYVPATSVFYTDAGIGLSNEEMVIQSVNWSIDGRNVEDVELSLERDESMPDNSILSGIFNPQQNTGSQSSGSSGAGDGIGGGFDDSVWTPINDDGSGVAVGDNYDNNQENQNQGGQNDTTVNRDGDTSTRYNKAVGANQFNNALYSTIRGDMDLSTDIFTAQGKFSIPGQKKPAADVGGMRPADNVMIVQSLGVAVKTRDGFSLPTGIGTGAAVDTGTDKISQIFAEVTVPSDILNDKISVSGIVSHGPKSTSGAKASCSIVLTNLKNNQSIRSVLVLPSRTDRAKLELVPETTFTTPFKQGDRIRLTISRNSSLGGDDKVDDSKSSITIHDAQINFNRSAFPSNSQANQFSQYS